MSNQIPPILADTDPARWRMVTVAGPLVLLVAKLAVKYDVPKHVAVELFSHYYDEARDDARQPQ